MLFFAVGDVHGCLDKLLELLDRCRRFANGRPSTFIFLGDFIDRGHDSRGVVETVMNMKTIDPERVIALAGNHEELLRLTDTSTGMGRWLINGGGATLRSYGVSSPKDLPAAHLAFFQGLPTFYDDGQRLFVHAGIRPGIPLEQQARDDLLWIREPFLSSTTNYGRLIVHGHSPTDGPMPDIKPNRVNVDTGAVFGGPLTAVAFTESERWPISVVQTRHG